MELDLIGIIHLLDGARQVGIFINLPGVGFPKVFSIGDDLGVDDICNAVAHSQDVRLAEISTRLNVGFKSNLETSLLQATADIGRNGVVTLDSWAVGPGANLENVAKVLVSASTSTPETGVVTSPGATGPARKSVES